MPKDTRYKMPAPSRTFGRNVYLYQEVRETKAEAEKRAKHFLSKHLLLPWKGKWAIYLRANYREGRK